MANWYIKVSSAWKQVNQAFFKSSSAWKEIQEGYIKESLTAKSEAYKQDQPQKTYQKSTPKASVVEDDDDDVPF